MANHISMGAPEIGEAEIAAVASVMQSGWITQGNKTKEFETNLCKMIGASSAIAMNNGTATLHAALYCCGVKPGDEVIVPSLTYISSVNTIILCGAVPVFVDADPNTFNITAEGVANALTERTKAVMTVDMKGMPVDFDAIREVIPSGVTFISDSAESLASIYKNDKVGSQADIHSFSFFANKNITTGEGGALTSGLENDDEYIARLRRFRNQGQGKTRYIHDELGFNYRFNDILAAIGIVQLKKIANIIQRKQEVVSRYNQILRGEVGIQIPFVPKYVTQHSWYNYCLKFENRQIRDKVQNELSKRGIETRVSFPPCHLQPHLQSFDYKIPTQLDQTESLYKTMLDIPCHGSIDRKQQDVICDTILKCMRQKR